jgi:hypothetical protein
VSALTNLSLNRARNSKHCYVVQMVKGSSFNNNPSVASPRVLSLPCSVLLICKESKLCEGLKSLPLEKEGTQVPFLLCAFGFHQQINLYIGDIGPFLSLFFILFDMLLVLVSFSLIFVYNFVFLFLTFYLTTVMPSRAQLGM